MNLHIDPRSTESMQPASLYDGDTRIGEIGDGTIAIDDFAPRLTAADLRQIAYKMDEYFSVKEDASRNDASP
jgi:hypothetical protein